MWRNIFHRSSSNKEKSTLRGLVKLEIFIDKIDTRTKTPITLSVKKEITIKELRRLISVEKNIEMDDLVLLINYRFWIDEEKLSEALNGMIVIDGGYIVYAVIITDSDQESIDYDIEKFLRGKYSTEHIVVPEPEFVVVNNKEANLQSQVNENIPVLCINCHGQKLQNSFIVVEYCRHEFCRECLNTLLKNEVCKEVKCPHPYCPRILIDHDYQKILGPEGYQRWSTLVQRKSHGDTNFKVPKVGWVCPSCTFLNKPYLKFCETCNDNRPDEYIVPRFYVPTKDEELIKQQDDEEKEKLEKEMQQIEVEKKERLEELKRFLREPVMYSSEMTECPICLMDYGPGEAVILHSCLHAICKDCLKNYLVNVEDAQVKCPTENCIGLVEDREISGILSKEEYQKYEDLNLRMAEAKVQSSFHCKEVNCTAWFIVDDRNVTTFICPKCKKNNCVSCEVVHENGQTCQQYQIIKLEASKDPSQSKNDLYIQSMINSGQAMKCPGCRMIVEKNRGCDGVLCRGCGMMICWATKGPRWGPKGKGDRSGGCGCRFLWGRRCHPNCHYCH